jgi:hypothetical protein
LRRVSAPKYYEMAACGTLLAWARAIAHSKATDLLHDEGKVADENAIPTLNSRRLGSITLWTRPGAAWHLQFASCARDGFVVVVGVGSPYVA